MKLLLFFSLLTVAIHVKSQDNSMPKFGINLQQEKNASFITNVSSTGVVVFLFYEGDTDTRIFVVHNFSKTDFVNLIKNDQIQLISEAKEVPKNYLAREKDLLFRFTNTRFFQYYYMTEKEENSLKKKF